MEIIWTKPATKDYLNKIDYLDANWSSKEVKSFIDKVNETIKIIKVNPKAFPVINYHAVHEVVIVSQITLFRDLYRMTR